MYAKLAFARQAGPEMAAFVRVQPVTLQLPDSSARGWWEAEVGGDGQWWWDSEVDLLVVGGLGLGQHHVIYV